jgi:hypothetical protein
MATRELTPTELTFHSFRHSQGSIHLQMRMLHAAKDASGIEPSFETDSATVERYLKFLSNRRGSTNNSSIRHTDTIFNPDTVSSNINSVGSSYHAFAPSIETEPIGEEIAQLETKRYRALLSGLLDSNVAMERAQQRERCGQTSFLFYFGRDARSTGFDVFNQMYAEAWQVASDATQGPKVVSLFEQHAVLVEAVGKRLAFRRDTGEVAV